MSFDLGLVLSCRRARLADVADLTCIHTHPQTSHQLPKRLDLSNHMGLFLQKTNIIRDYLEDWVDGRAFWPQEVRTNERDGW